MSSGASNSNDHSQSNFAKFVRWILLAALVYLLLIAVSTIGAGFARAAGDRAKSLFDFAKNPFAGLVIGIVATGLIQSSSTVSSIIVGLVAGGLPVTVIVQSSSTTTSLIVPLAGTGVFSLRQVYAFTLGANIGTCFTALLAATAVSGDDAILALQIAIVHLLFNIFGILIVYGIPFLRAIPIWGAQRLADAAVKRKVYAVAYVLGLFFIIPVAILTVSKFMGY